MSESIPATAHDAQVNGIRLHYVTWGAPTAPDRAVVLLHGVTMNCLSLAPLGEALGAAGWYAIALDLRGRGLSEKPPHGYGIPYHANDVLSLADHLSLPTVHLAGHSLGAQISQFLAAVHPGRVGKVVLIDSGGKIPDDAYATVASSVDRLGKVYPSLDAYLEARREASASIHPWSDFWERVYRYDAEVRPDGSVMSRVPREAVVEEATVNFAIRGEALPAMMRAPTLIVRAALGTIAADRGFILPPDEGERVQREIAGSKLIIIPDTNHYTVALPPAFSEAVLAFLGERG